MFGDDIGQTDLAANRAHRGQQGPRLDAVGDHRVFSSAKASDTIHADVAGARAADAAAQGIEEVLQIDDLRFLGGIADERGPLSEGRRHHQVLGGADAREVQVDLPSPQARSLRVNVPAPLANCRPHSLQARQVQVDGSKADGTASRVRNPDPTHPAEERSHEEDGRPHLPHKLVRHLVAVQRISPDHQRPPATREALVADVCSQASQNLLHHRRVPQARSIQYHALGPRQQAGGQDRQGSVLCAVHPYLSPQAHAAPHH